MRVTLCYLQWSMNVHEKAVHSRGERAPIDRSLDLVPFGSIETRSPVQCSSTSLFNGRRTVWIQKIRCPMKMQNTARK